MSKGKRIYEEGGVVANTILQQLGGAGRLRMMTGAYNFIDLKNGLSFRLKNQRANYVKITLNGKDLYDVEVGRIRGDNYKVVAEEKDVYNDQLKKFIEKSTGMYLSFESGGNIDSDSGEIEGLKAQEAIYLYVKRAIKSPYREKYLKPAGLWQTDKSDEIEKNLIKKGYLNKAGSITDSGKDKAKSVDVASDMIISRNYISGLDLKEAYKKVVQKFSGKYSEGGELNEDEEDLFEDIESLPPDVQAVLQKYESEDNTYENMEQMLSEVEALGYTFDYGLDAVPFGLRKIEKPNLNYKIDRDEMSVEVDEPTMKLIVEEGIMSMKEARKIKSGYIFWYDALNESTRDELEDFLGEDLDDDDDEDEDEDDEKFSNGGEIESIEKAIKSQYGDIDKKDGILSKDLESLLKIESNRNLKMGGRFIYSDGRIYKFDEIIDALEKRGWKIYGSKKFANGGKVRYSKEDDRADFKNYHGAIGSFGWKYDKQMNDAILYPLSEGDKEFYAHLNLKQGESLYRYKTHRRQNKILIKINLSKSLLYFLKDSEDDKNPVFETKGIKPLYILLSEKEKFDNGGNVKAVNSNDIKQGARFKIKGGTVFIIDEVKDGEVHTSFEGGKKGNYVDTVEEAVDFLNENSAQKIRNYSKGGVTKRNRFNIDDLLEEEDRVWNADGNKLIVDRVTNDEYFFSGFGYRKPRGFSKKQVHEYLEKGTWTLKPKK